MVVTHDVVTIEGKHNVVMKVFMLHLIKEIFFFIKEKREECHV